MAGASFDMSGPARVDLDMRVACDGGTFMTRLRQLADAKAAADSALAELRLGQAAWAAHANARARQDEAARVRAAADGYAARVRAEADSYAAKIRSEADKYAANARIAADSLIGKAASAEAAAAASQQEAQAALAAYREAKELADRAKANADAKAARFDRKIAGLNAALENARADLAGIDGARGRLDRQPLLPTPATRDCSPTAPSPRRPGAGAMARTAERERAPR